MNEKSINRLILIISVVIPVVVTALFYMPAVKLNFDTTILPGFHALLNSGVAVCLLLGLFLIRRGHRNAHRNVMLSAFSLSALFLISYVLYHLSADSTMFGDTDHDGLLSDSEKTSAGSIRYLYYAVLLSHILLAAAVLPFILITLSRGLTARYDKHRRIARITWPIWFYVAVTGVVVYLMIAPYYP